MRSNHIQRLRCGRAAETRHIAPLLATPARVHWLSVEPLLEAVDLAPWLGAGGIGWVIVGGESGAGAGAMLPSWARAIRDQCRAAAAAFWFKQTGTNSARWPSVTGKGEVLAELPADLPIRELPPSATGRCAWVGRLPDRRLART